MALYLLYFAIFSLLGWVLEVAFSAIRHGKFVNRGFNSGPVCPIYGFCIALLRLVLHPLADTWILLYVASVLLATVIELLTGFIMDKIFDTKWWDYSKNKCNLGGYICLSFSLIWGALCVFIVKVLFPPVDALYSVVSPKILYPILILFYLILLLDFCASINIARGFDKHLKLLSELSDILKTGSNTLGKGVYIGTKKVEVLYLQILEKTPKIYRRIASAFPTMRTKHQEQLRLLREKMKRGKKKTESDLFLIPEGSAPVDCPPTPTPPDGTTEEPSVEPTTPTE